MPTTPSEGLLRRLSLRDLIVSGMLFIGPLAPVGVFGVLHARSGDAVALVYVIATVAMGFTAWSYARMSTAVPRAGSVFAYASAGLGRPAGFVSGWMIMLDYLLIPSVAALFVGIATNSLLPTVPPVTNLPQTPIHPGYRAKATRAGMSTSSCRRRCDASKPSGYRPVF